MAPMLSTRTYDQITETAAWLTERVKSLPTTDEQRDALVREDRAQGVEAFEQRVNLAPTFNKHGKAPQARVRALVAPYLW